MVLEGNEKGLIVSEGNEKDLMTSEDIEKDLMTSEDIDKGNYEFLDPLSTQIYFIFLDV